MGSVAHRHLVVIVAHVVEAEVVRLNIRAIWIQPQVRVKLDSSRNSV